MVKFAFAFLVGVCLFQAMPVVPSVPLLCLCASISILSFFHSILRVFSYLLTGFIWSWLFAIYLSSNQISESVALSIETVVGEVIGVPYQTDKDFSKFIFITSAYRTNNGALVNKTMNIRLYWNNDIPNLQTGDEWQLEVKLKPPVGYANPGSFDREKWLFVNNIQATGSVKKSNANRLIRVSDKGSINSLRQHISQLIHGESGYQHPDLLNALAIGVKHSINQQTWELLQDTGTAHLVAISGLHVGLVSGMVVMLASYFWRATPFSAKIPALKVGAAAGILTSVLYTALAGFAIPTVRAMIMLNALYFSMLLNIRIQPWNILTTAILCILIINPVSVLSNGFWLSFLAVTWIIYFLSNRSTHEGKLKIAIKLQMILALGLLPVMLTDFQKVSLVSPVANLVAVPFLSLLIVPTIMIAMVTLPFSDSLFLKLLYVPDYLLMVIFEWINYTGQLVLASYSASLPKNLLLILVPGLLLLISPVSHISKVAGVIMLGLLPNWKPDYPDKGDIWMTVLDVGQGLAIVVQTTNHVLVYDAGAVFPSGYNMGKQVVLPYLRESGVNHIDTLMISHSDIDHSGGAQAVFQGIETDKILAGEPGRISWAKSNHCYESSTWNWDSVTFTMLSPEKQQSGNNGSCVLQITDASGSSILIPGDIEWPVEHHLVNNYQNALNSEVLIAAHHGSKTSSRMPFLNNVYPESIVIPAGYKNRFRFPHDSVLEKYRSLRAKIYITGLDGAIFVKSDKDSDGFSIDTYREINKHYWQTALK